MVINTAPPMPEPATLPSNPELAVSPNRAPIIWPPKPPLRALTMSVTNHAQFVNERSFTTRPGRHECRGALVSASRRSSAAQRPRRRAWITSPSGVKREPWHGQSQVRSAVFHATRHHVRAVRRHRGQTSGVVAVNGERLTVYAHDARPAPAKFFGRVNVHRELPADELLGHSAASSPTARTACASSRTPSPRGSHGRPAGRP